MNEFWSKVGHLNIDQANYIKELIEKYDPKYVLETGFCTGRSASVILTNGKNIKRMVSIDINFDYMHPEGRIYKELLENKFSNFKAIESNSKLVLNDDFFKNVFPHGIDWFTVDGDHSYQGCLFDLNAVINHMNKNSIIIIDDYKSGPPNGCHIPEVTQACDDFYKNHQYLEKHEWNVLGKGFCIFKKN